MRKLISAGFARLWKDRMFAIGLAFVTLASVFLAWMKYRTAQMSVEETTYVENALYNLLPVLSFVGALFISLRLGAEFDDHTIRNKLIVGHRRSEIYFAEYIVCLAGSELLLMAMLAVSGFMGWLFFGKFMLNAAANAWLMLCCMLLTAVCSAICVGVGMNVHGRAAAVIGSVLLLFALLMLSSYFGNALNESPTTYSYVSVSVDGVEFGDLMDNPAYVGGAMRSIYQWIYDALPTGQAIQIHLLDCERAARFPTLSALLLAIATPLGYLPFHKRDIR